jgi:molybdopterin converting factor small subunit
VDIEVRCFANLADYLPPTARGARATLAVPDGATVADVLHRLALPEGLPRLVLVNGTDADPARRLAAGDVVSVLPPLAGGSG